MRHRGYAIAAQLQALGVLLSFAVKQVTII